jgi:hypothetical protein
MQIALHYRKDKKGPVEPILRAADYLQSVGITLLDKGDRDPEPAKGVFFAVQQYFLTKKVIDSQIPTVLLENADSAIACSREETKHSFVRAVVKIATLRDWQMNNISKGRYHSYLLGVRLGSPVLLSKSEAAKLTPGATYGAYDVMAWWQDRDYLEANREYDCHFAGSIIYEHRDELTKHRTDALSLLKQIPGKHCLSAGRLFPRETYNIALAKSKVCISPWGYGELCYRDFEALYAGCVLVKPNSDFVQCWPDVMKSGIYYVACSADWSDLVEVVRKVLDSWDSFEEMRVNNRQTLLKFWNPIQIGRRYQSIFEGAFNDSLVMGNADPV